jgi:hypothetical protein
MYGKFSYQTKPYQTKPNQTTVHLPTLNETANSASLNVVKYVTEVDVLRESSKLGFKT